MADAAEILHYFKNAIKLNLLSHGYLLLGGRGAGRLECLRQILPSILDRGELASPDLKFIEPNNDYIGIDEIRSLRFWLQESPLAGARKAAVILEGQRLGIEAQNAFLKILEEPARSSIIFILAGHRRQLLATIVSRLAPIYFTAPAGHLPEKEIAGPTLLEISQTREPADKLQRWLELKLDKNKSRDWLQANLWQLRGLLRDRMAQGQITADLAASGRTILEALNNPKGQNWQLLCENLLLNI